MRSAAGRGRIRQLPAVAADRPTDRSTPLTQDWSNSTRRKYRLYFQCRRTSVRPCKLTAVARTGVYWLAVVIAGNMWGRHRTADCGLRTGQRSTAGHWPRAVSASVPPSGLEQGCETRDMRILTSLAGSRRSVVYWLLLMLRCAQVQTSRQVGRIGEEAASSTCPAHRPTRMFCLHGRLWIS